MTAPSAPVITSRIADLGAIRLRWTAVTGAATYNVYRNGSLLTTGLTGTETVVQAGSGESLTLTAVNAGAEESSASNAIVVGPSSATSFPPTGPRGPYRSPFG